MIANKNDAGNLNAQFQLANPSQADTFYLGGEEIPVAAALGVSSAPLTLVDDTSSPGVFGFSSPTFVATNLSAAISVVRSNGVFGVVSMKYSTTNITAIAGTDYVGLTNQNMVFSSGQTTNGFSVTIKNDGYITNVEKTASNSRSSILGTTPGATFGISNAVLRIINPSYPGLCHSGRDQLCRRHQLGRPELYRESHCRQSGHHHAPIRHRPTVPRSAGRIIAG